MFSKARVAVYGGYREGTERVQEGYSDGTWNNLNLAPVSDRYGTDAGDERCHAIHLELFTLYPTVYQYRKIPV